MRLIEGLRKPFLNADEDAQPLSHQWGRTGVTLLVSKDSAVERCSSCHSYRIRGQVEWETEGGTADECPGKPLHPWEV